jgi:hypothetical protein
MQVHETSGTSDPNPSGPSRPSTICLDRALPPVPEPLMSPTKACSPRIPVSPTPTRTDSCVSSVCSRSKSPSIANLGHLSVVTQRLAQSERHQYPHSVPTSPAPLYQNSSVIRTRSLCVQIPSGNDTTSLASPTSILESYAETCSAVNGVVSPSVDHIHVHPEHEKHNRSGSQDESSIHQPQNISPARAPSSDTRDFILTDIHQMMSDLTRRTEETENSLNIIQNQLRQPTRPEFDSTAITQALGDINGKLRSDLPYIMKLLAQIQACQSDPSPEGKEIPPESVEAPSCDLDKVHSYLFYTTH